MNSIRHSDDIWKALQDCKILISVLVVIVFERSNCSFKCRNGRPSVTSSSSAQIHGRLVGCPQSMPVQRKEHLGRKNRREENVSEAEWENLKRPQKDGISLLQQMEES